MLSAIHILLTYACTYECDHCFLHCSPNAKGTFSFEQIRNLLGQAREIATWAANVVVKIPSTTQGLEVISVLAKENIKVNMTLCFSLNQALLGALAGAAYVSPFVGRLDDVGHDGMQLVKDIVEVFRYYHMKTEVLAASICHPLHCVVAAKAGAHVATVPFKVLMQMMKHPLTDVGNAQFLSDWKSVQQR